MIEKYKYITALTLLVALLLLSFFLGRNTKDCNESIHTVVKRDTIVIVKPSEPIVLEKVKTKLVFKRDTIIETKPFTAVVDTVIKQDTVYAKFDFPENSFDLWVRKKPDSSIVHTISITKEIVKERPWWEASAYTLGGTIIGFLLGKTVK